MKLFYSFAISPVMVPFLILFLVINKKNHIFVDLARWSEVIKAGS